MPKKKVLIKVERQKRGKMRYFTHSITTDGETFITVSVDDTEGGFEWTPNKSMCKEFFRKIKAQSALKNKAVVNTKKSK